MELETLPTAGRDLVLPSRASFPGKAACIHPVAESSGENLDTHLTTSQRSVASLWAEISWQGQEASITDKEPGT